MQETCIDDRVVEEGSCTPGETDDLGKFVALQCLITNDSCCPDDGKKEEECLIKPDESQMKKGADR